MDSFNQSPRIELCYLNELPQNKLTIYSKWVYKYNAWNRSIKVYELDDLTKKEFDQAKIDDPIILSKKERELSSTFIRTQQKPKDLNEYKKLELYFLKNKLLYERQGLNKFLDLYGVPICSSLIFVLAFLLLYEKREKDYTAKINVKQCDGHNRLWMK